MWSNFMADVRPLRGIRYAASQVGDMASVVTPPYDVISKEAQAGYYARSPYNVIRLELGQEFPDDNSLNNVYTRAAATLSEWRLQGTLREEETASYYLYQQVFSYEGQQYTRTSLIARVRLETWDARVVLPHEHTLAKAKDDRVKLLRACATNLSPIMCLYDDPQGRIRRLLAAYEAQPEVQLVDEAGEEHRLTPVTDAQHVALIQNFFEQRQLYIADGHHRYETALAYRDEVREQRNGLHPDDAANFVMMALIDLDDPGMLVLPTHRVLFNLDSSLLDTLTPERLGQFFTAQTVDTNATSDALLQRLQQIQEPAMLLGTAQGLLLLTLNEQSEQRMRESGHSDAWNTLDVAVAQRLILEDMLSLSASDLTAGTYVRYLRDAGQALQAVQSGEAQLAILLNATRVRQICEVAEADDRMPQKSTYFYPKLITGLVMNPLW